MSDGVQFIDADQQQGSGFGKGVSFRDIVMEQFRRCAVNGSKEWKGGYWSEKVMVAKMGEYSSQVWVPDSRQEFIHAVNILHDLLINLEDDKFKEQYKEWNENWQNLRNELNELMKQGRKKSGEAFNDKAECWRGKFRALNKLMHRLQYLEGGSYEEDV